MTEIKILEIKQGNKIYLQVLDGKYKKKLFKFTPNEFIEFLNNISKKPDLLIHTDDRVLQNWESFMI